MNYYNVGKIIATHGLKGEVKVALTTDFPEDRFRAGSRLYLGDDSREVTVAAGRPFKQFWLVTFAEITDIDQAEKLKGTEILISEEDQGEPLTGSTTTGSSWAARSWTMKAGKKSAN